MGANNCFEQVLKNLKSLTRDDMEDFVTNVRYLMRTEGITARKALEQAQDHLLTKVLDYKKWKLARDTDLLYAKTGWVNKVRSGKIKVSQILAKDDNPVNRSKNIESRAESNAVRYRQNFFKISKEAQSAAMDGSVDAEVAKYRDKILRSTDPNYALAKELGDFSLKNEDLLTSDLVRAGVLDVGKIAQKRYSGMYHDSLKISGQSNFRGLRDAIDKLNKFATGKSIRPFSVAEARDRWIKFTKPLLDESLSNVAEEDLDEELPALFDRITSNTSESETGFNNLHKSMRRTLVFKDYQSYLKYWKEFGEGNGTLFSVWLRDMQNTAHDVSVGDVLGSNPDKAFGILNDEQKLKQGKSANPIKEFSKAFTSNTKLYNTVMQYSNTPSFSTWANFNKSMRAYLGAVKLVGLSVLSVNDAHFGSMAAAALFDNGHPVGQYFANVLDKLKAIPAFYGRNFGGEIPAETSYMLKSLYHSLQFEQGGMMRVVHSTDVGQISSKVLSKFYKWIGMSDKDELNRLYGMVQVGRGLQSLKDINLTNLPRALQARFAACGINNLDWDFIRSNFKYLPEIEGERFPSADMVDHIPKDVLNAYISKVLDSPDASRTMSPTDVHVDLVSKISTYLNTGADDAIFTPGAKTNALLYQGTRAGTPEGELLRNFMQFKGFMVEYLKRGLINSYREDTSYMKMNWVLSNFLYSLPLTIVGNAVYDIMNGQKPKLDPSQWGVTEWLNNLLPALGSVNSSFQGKNDPISKLFSSPTTNAILDVSHVVASGAQMGMPSQGSYKTRVRRFKKTTAKLAYDTTPIRSIPMVSGMYYNNFLKGKGNKND